MSKNYLLAVVLFFACVRPSVSPPQKSRPVPLPTVESCTRDDVEGCQRRCDEGDLSSCVSLGDIYQRGEKVAPDLEKVTLYRKACEGGDLEACLDAAMRLEGGPQDDLAGMLYQKACDGGEAEGCYSLGLREETNNLPKAIALYQKACDGEAEACQALADLYQKGKGVPKDLAKAAPLYKKACDGLNGEIVYEGCIDLADLYTKGEGVTQDLTLARSLYQKACDAGFAPSLPGE